MSKPPSFCIWSSHHLSSSYKEKEKTAHSICAGDPRKKQPLSTTNTRELPAFKRKRGIFAALYSGAGLALNGLHVKAAELLKWNDLVVETYRDYTAAPALL